MIGVPLISPEPIAALAARLGGSADAEALERVAARLVAPADASADSDLVLVVSRRVLATASGAPGVFLATPELGDALPRGRRWIHQHAMFAAARLLVEASSPPAPAIHPSAVVSTDAVIGPETRIGPLAVVLGAAQIGARCEIGPGAVIYDGVRIGSAVVIGANAVIGRPGFGWTTGPDGRTLRVPQPGGVEIEDEVEIGALSSVDSGTLAPTRIRHGAKLDAHVHVGHNAEIGPGALIAAQSGFAGSVKIGKDVLVGGQTGVADHVSVGDGARLAAKSGVIGDVPARAIVAGFPAVPRVKWLRAMARLLALAVVDRRTETQ